MKLDRAKLLAATEKALAADLEAFQAEERKRATEGATRLSEWIVDYGPAWLDFAERIQYLVRNGYPVTDHDAPRAKERYRGIPWGHESWLKPAEVREYKRPANLVNLRNVLAASTDEYVTQSALKGLGTEPLRTVLAYL